MFNKVLSAASMIVIGSFVLTSQASAESQTIKSNKPVTTFAATEYLTGADKSVTVETITSDGSAKTQTSYAAKSTKQTKQTKATKVTSFNKLTDNKYALDVTELTATKTKTDKTLKDGSGFTKPTGNTPDDTDKPSDYTGQDFTIKAGWTVT